MALFLVAIVALAYRGKGGLFEQWGINGGTVRHALGALLVGAALAILVGSTKWFPVFVAGWFIYTRPTPHRLFQTLDLPTARERLRAIPMAYARQALILPLCLAVYWAGDGSLWGFLGFIPLGFVYYLGGAIQRRTGIDGVEAAEWLTGFVGLMFYALA